MNKSTAGNDQDILLSCHLDMKQHVTALQKANPQLADKVENTHRASSGAINRISIRSLAARLVLQGLYDKEAEAIIAEHGAKVLSGMLAKGKDLPDGVKRAMDALGL